MKLFESAQKYLAEVGIHLVPTKIAPFSGKSLRLLLWFIVSQLLACLFLFFEAQKFDEYVSTFYTCFTLFIITTHFLILILKSRKLFKFINDMGEFVEKSEYNLSIDSVENNKKFVQLCIF